MRNPYMEFHIQVHAYMNTNVRSSRYLPNLVSKGNSPESVGYIP